MTDAEFRVKLLIDVKLEHKPYSIENKKAVMLNGVIYVSSGYAIYSYDGAL